MGKKNQEMRDPMVRHGKNLVHYIIVEHDDHRGQKPIDDDDDDDENFLFPQFLRIRNFFSGDGVLFVLLRRFLR